MKKLFIGTSGWVYPHWEGIFYPEGLSSKDKLKYFSKHFKTTEKGHCQFDFYGKWPLLLNKNYLK